MAHNNIIYLYTDNPSPALSIDELFKRLAKNGVEVSYMGDFLTHVVPDLEDQREIKREFESALVGDIEKPLDKFGGCTAPSLPPGTGTSADEPIKLYDGYWLQRCLFRAMWSSENKDRSPAIHIVLTDKLIGTYDIKRYHARVVLTGVPAIISTSGLVEAPARPREYYFMKASYLQSGRDLGELDSIFWDRYLVYDDERTTSVTYSYILQVLSYEITGVAFCEDRSCCLYNSHWQEGLLDTQLKGELCEAHLEKLGVQN